MQSESAKRKREAKKARVAAVKALGLKPGDLVSYGSKRGVFPASAFILDARHERFQFLRRATPEEQTKYQAKQAEEARRKAERAAYNAREDVQIAAALASDYERLLSLGLDRLRLIQSWLDAADEKGAR